eukprot:scpid96833/ scgid28273/ 
MVKAAEEIGVDIQLRVTHTSHVSQVADVANYFPAFKRKARQAKSDLLVKKVLGGQPPRPGVADMPAIVKQTWEDAFHASISRKGWAEIGFDPATKCCNRKLFWDLKLNEEATKEKLNQSNASGLVLDTSCIQFQQHAATADDNECTSDSSDSGDSGANVDNLRLGGEDFR